MGQDDHPPVFGAKEHTNVGGTRSNDVHPSFAVNHDCIAFDRGNSLRLGRCIGWHETEAARYRADPHDSTKKPTTPGKSVQLSLGLRCRFSALSEPIRTHARRRSSSSARTTLRSFAFADSVD